MTTREDLAFRKAGSEMKNRTASIVFVSAISITNVLAQAGEPTTSGAAQPARTSTGVLVDLSQIDTNDNAPRSTPVGMSFTYQGELQDSGSPANGEYDIRFTLYDDLGAIVSGPICLDNVLVTNGLFTADLDFGQEFYGDMRELGIAVRPGGALGNCDSGGGYTTLNPRQRLNAAPYALGLSLPFTGTQFSSSDVFTIFNTTGDSSTAGIHGILEGLATFSFIDSAGVRGESSNGFGAGVLGISESYAGVVGYSAGDFGTGTFGRADGVNGTAVRGSATNISGIAVSGEAFAADSWAGYFSGRGYFSDRVGIGTNAPVSALDVSGTITTNALKVTTGAGTGRVMTSDSSGNASWQAPSPSGLDAFYNSGSGTFPLAATQFLSTTVTVTIAAGQSIHVTANQTFGSTFAGGAGSLDIFIGYRVAGSGVTPTTIGGGMFNISVPQNTRMPFGVSAVITGLPAGTYEVGMAGDDDGNGQWNNGEWGYVSVLVLN